MPRGMRIVPGGELATNLHHEARPQFTFVSADCVVLVVTCWCERSCVEVPQWVVRHLGDTLSCGRPRCRGPQGQDHVVPPIRTHRYKSVGYVSRVIARRASLAGQPPTSFEDVEARRDLVAEMYRNGRSLPLIARDCGVDPTTIRADLAHLRSLGVVA